MICVDGAGTGAGFGSGLGGVCAKSAPTMAAAITPIRYAGLNIDFVKKE